jgi:FkbM family methyltransferase
LVVGIFFHGSQQASSSKFPTAPRKNDAFSMHGRVCNSDEISLHLKHLEGLGGFSAATRCPKEKWLNDWRRELSKTRQNSFSFFEVGCNKATDAILMLRLFTQNEKVDLDVWLRETGFTNFACEIDKDLWVDIKGEKLHGISHYQHYCIEPVAENFDTVDIISKKLGYDRLGLRVHQMALSSTDLPSMVQFPRAEKGVEVIGIDVGFRNNDTYEVPVTTLDKFVLNNGVLQMDALKVDTEGNDPRVLLGATKALLLLKPSYVMFENHNIGHWETYQLKDLIDFLDGLSYTCFWATHKATLVQITNCWHEAYETMKGWSNIACFNRQDAMLGRIMESHSVK